MSDRPPRLALWVLLPILGGVTLAGEFLLFHFGLGADALGAPAAAAVAGLVYLAWAAPAGSAPAPRVPAAEEEPFDDPVEEADRIAETAPEPAPDERVELAREDAKSPSGPPAA